MTNNDLLDKIAISMSETFQKKSEEIKKFFASLSQEERYQALIDLGRKLPPYPDSLKTPDRIVRGCQSALFLFAAFENGKLFFTAHSDALISKGLAALLIALYSGEAPETILAHPPTLINELGLTTSLSPTRSNGLSQIYLRMKQLAIFNFK